MEVFLSDFHWDFAVILTVAALVTGVIYLLDVLVFAPRRRAAGSEKGNWAVEFSRSFFPVILVVLLLRSFAVEPFRIPSGSMIPTLLVGDFILVDKHAYGLRSPVGFWQITEGSDPERGDVAVFRFPVEPSKDFIKRVIGLPGDHIVYRDKRLTINGQDMPVEPGGVVRVPGVPGGVVERYIERIGDVQHPIIVNPNAPSRSIDFIVPEGEYFVMGDNRDGSDDSRRWGTVPERNLVGRAFLIWMNWNGELGRPNFSRIGTIIE
ncbi:signal peptidase I [Algiphilus aromaticivorans]|uniref:signal peptidase I n=1 Tax=Algiphilus aromaticivorans TaxID=382454 RepID=UPI000ABEDD2D|nr:signal peptidase I [Algiphilus aromaticivorans]